MQQGFRTLEKIIDRNVISPNGWKKISGTFRIQDNPEQASKGRFAISHLRKDPYQKFWELKQLEPDWRLKMDSLQAISRD